ncbi:MAG: TIGR02206 family membrane protein [Bacteroidota bacterium]|nr:TIGR02206 family membrane protein [Bacteroidota bacterium]
MNHEHYLVPIGSMTWWSGIILSVIVGIVLILFGRYLIATGKEEKFRRTIFWILVCREIFLYGYIIYLDRFTIKESLPFHLCNISYIGLLIFLYKPQFFIYEFLLMLSLGGAVQSLYTPEMTHGFSYYFLIDYYLSHSAIIFAPLYAFFVLGMLPRDYSWFKIWIAAHIVLGTVGILNYFIQSNYIYLCHPPKVDNPMVMGTFPYHLLSFELFGTLHIILMYSLFKFILRPGNHTLKLS